MRYVKNKKGAIEILFALWLVSLLGFSALAVDVGMLAYEKSQLQNAVDASALAGAQELPGSTTDAETVAKNYIVQNSEGDASVQVSFSESNHKITVDSQKNISYIFARVFGMSTGTVSARASAVIAPTNAVYNGLRPFGVVDDVFELNQQVVLKEGAWDSNQGNFAPIAIDDRGGNVYKDTILDGSKTGLTVGDLVDTETGNMVGPSFTAVKELIDRCPHNPACTSSSYQDDCPRIITVPLIDTLMVNGRSEVQVMGFAKFFLEDVSKDPGGSAQIIGTFIEKLNAGGSNPANTDYGLRGVRLVD